MIENNTISNQKSELRKICRQRLKNIDTSQWQKYGERMSALLFQNDIWKNAECVFCFVSLFNEPDTSLILSKAIEQGKTLCVPRVVGDSIMQAVKINTPDELQTATMGIKEPPKSNPNILSHKDIDLAVVPCLAGSLDGTRLGKGGGYYDKFLSEYSSTSVLLCSDEFLFEFGEIPTDSHDMKCDYVITQTIMNKCI